MKKLLALLLAAGGMISCPAAIYQNYFTTNANPVVSGPTNGLDAAALASGTNTFNGAGMISNALTATYAFASSNSVRVFNIVDYGADGSDDEVGLDQIALQNAINAVRTNGAGIVWIPAGTYYHSNISYAAFTSEGHSNIIDLTIVPNLIIRGEGRGKTILKLWPTNGTPSGDYMNWFGSGETTVGTVGGCTNLIFENLTLDGNKDAQDYSYDLTQLYIMGTTVFRDMNIINSAEDAIDCQGRVYVERVHFTNINNTCIGSGGPQIARDCIVFNGGIGTADGGVLFEVNSPNYGIVEDTLIYGGSGVLNANNAAATFRGCTFVFTNSPTRQAHIYANGNGANVTIDNCYFSRPSGSDTWAVSASAQAIVKIINSTFTADVRGIVATNAAVKLIGNRFQGQSDNNILIDGSLGAVISGNTIIGALGAGIAVMGTAGERADGLQIIGNEMQLGHIQFSSGSLATNCLIAFNRLDGDSSLRAFGATAINNRFVGNFVQGTIGGGGLMDFEYPQLVKDNENFVFTVRSAQAGHYFENNGWRNPVSTVGAGQTYYATNYYWRDNYWMTNRLSPFNPSSPRTLTASATLNHYAQTVIFNGSSLTCTLPSAATVAAGWSITVKNINASALTIATQSSQTVDGTTPATLAQYASRTFYSDGSNWLLSNPLVGSGAGLTSIPPTTGLAGWPANSAGFLENNGSGTLSWGTPSGTLPSDPGAASTLTNNSSGDLGWYPMSAIGGSVTITNTTGLPGVVVGSGSSFGIGTNLSGLGGDAFWKVTDNALIYTNLFGGSWNDAGAAPLLQFSSTPLTVLSDDVSYFGQGIVFDMGGASPSTYYIGDVSVPGAPGDFNLGNGSVESLTSSGLITTEDLQVNNDATVDGNVLASGGLVFAGGLTASNRVMMVGADGYATNALASGPVPINADCTASTSAQIGGLFTGGGTYLKSDGTSGDPSGGSSSFNFIPQVTTNYPFAFPSGIVFESGGWRPGGATAATCGWGGVFSGSSVSGTLANAAGGPDDSARSRFINSGTLAGINVRDVFCATNRYFYFSARLAFTNGTATTNINKVGLYCAGEASGDASMRIGWRATSANTVGTNWVAEYYNGSTFVTLYTNTTTCDIMQELALWGDRTKVVWRINGADVATNSTPANIASAYNCGPLILQKSGASAGAIFLQSAQLLYEVYARNTTQD